MIQSSSNLVNLKKFANLEAAQREAGAEAANTGAISIPVVAFRQGRRTVVTGALPMSWVTNRLESRSARSAKKGGSMTDARASWNRPEITEHSQAIARYITENYKKAYIIPPLSLNVQQTVNLYIPDYPNEFLPGYLVIPGAAKLAVTDGQHRKSAISLALDQMDEEDASHFGSDAVAVMITCETDVNQIHQDFADCSKTKALPPSLLAVYDRRNPANRLVSDLEKMCPVFAGRIDPTSTTLSKKSTYLFLANQLRQLVKELLAGSYALADVDFEKRALELLGTEEQYENALVKFSGYINFLSGVIPVWQEIVQLSPGSLATSQVPNKRSEGWVCLTATGLNVIGRLGHILFTRSDLEPRWQEFAQKLGDPQIIDWRRTAGIWQGNIIQGQKLLTQQVPLRNAVLKVSEAIGLPLKPQNGIHHDAASNQTLQSTNID